ncbi:MAG: flavodoxin-dependent (E)-4-hydroxy-3-methylbut-2-enyl-diphosphate synthase [Clostridia bacterium]|nr:flavodoxin-dependent (E)-4-hydroxy-3-methylbut-2-enyl-diphosphate synthase [Clostridia bacterium]MBQ6123413.1 flavodoxin-dependent (E)-4-hydroxy-3-methylbut-2-enyl-diphosphate synthase [Clostridia bacterium]
MPTRKVHVGPVPIGGGAPISVQTMTNTDTRDVEATLAQIRAMAAAGADIVRVSVYDEACAKAVRDLVDGSPVPLVADIHFNHRLAIQSVENGIAKVRINPGNIGGEAHVRELADCLKAHRVPVRIGVNSGSVEKEILERYGGVTPEGMVESGLNHARMLERAGYDDIVLSFKATDVRKMVAACRLAAKACDYPQHIGVTESGTADVGIVKSAVGIGALLLEGIGDTIRVSLSGDPVQEVPAGLSILRACGLRRDGIEIISCPTCGRTGIDVEGIARRVRAETADIRVPLKVAVMGCVVNGPGEAREADLGVAGGKDGAGILFVKDMPPRSIKGGDLAAELIAEIRRMVEAR